MINRDNYRETIKTTSIASMPADLKEMHDFFNEATDSGTNWAALEDGDVRFVIDKYFKKLESYIESEVPASKRVNTESNSEKETKDSVEPKQNSEKKQRGSRSTKAKFQSEQESPDEVELVERIPEEIKFIRRFISFNGKRKSKEDFLRIINALHKAIIEKRIRKSSRYAKEIIYIQETLVKTYNSISRPTLVEINPKTLSTYKELVKTEKVLPSVSLIKRYINLNGKYGVKDKAAVLIESMKRAYDKGKVQKSDNYIEVFDRMYANLNQYVKNKGQKILSIEETELNGLNGILEGCNCENLNGIDSEFEGTDEEIPESVIAPAAKPGVMNSLDFRNLQFKTLGFVGKYRQLMGDPSPGFTAMVYGRPKMGKSILCVDFAGYLARNHGPVLYVAKEEGLDYTLQEKLKAKDVAHENLFVADHIPDDLSSYEYIFFDSVNKLGLSTEDLYTLRKNNPSKSFIYIFQTTKDGNFRGANEFQHDVDIVIQVPEKGLAVQNGRFNQGGQMSIFSDESNSSLNGRPPKNKETNSALGDWPIPKYLSKYDLFLLERIKSFYDRGEYEMAMDTAMQGETEVREAIPPAAWKKMGGKLTPTGEEKLRKSK